MPLSRRAGQTDPWRAETVLHKTAKALPAMGKAFGTTCDADAQLSLWCFFAECFLATAPFPAAASAISRVSPFART